MIGNLSKKKGLLGDITEENLDYIAGKLNAEYGGRLDAAESDIKEQSEQLLDAKKELEQYTDDMVNEAYVGIEALKKNKEDKANKTYQMSMDNILPNELELYPSVYAVRGFGYEIKESLAESYRETLRINYYDKYIIDEKIGDIESALDELHNYAQSLIGGDAS